MHRLRQRRNSTGRASGLATQQSDCIPWQYRDERESKAEKNLVSVGTLSSAITVSPGQAHARQNHGSYLFVVSGPVLSGPDCED